MIGLLKSSKTARGVTTSVQIGGTARGVFRLVWQACLGLLVWCSKCVLRIKDSLFIHRESMAHVQACTV